MHRIVYLTVNLRYTKWWWRVSLLSKMDTNLGKISLEGCSSNILLKVRTHFFTALIFKVKRHVEDRHLPRATPCTVCTKVGWSMKITLCKYIKMVESRCSALETRCVRIARMLIVNNLPPPLLCHFLASYNTCHQHPHLITNRLSYNRL